MLKKKEVSTRLWVLNFLSKIEWLVIWLMQMSDVPQGGATVFPHLNVALRPKKGSAAFWYNLHASGEGDFLTRHAACPVLAGSKWGEYH